MAKTDEIKFIDQHLEKIILGLCAVIMAYGVFQWVISKPQRSEVPEVNRNVVPADEVDQALFDWATIVKQRTPQGPPPGKAPNYEQEIAKHRTPAAAARITDWGDHRRILVPPVVVTPPDPPELIKVQAILDKFAPVFSEIKGKRELTDEEGGVDKLVFRGIGTFPRGELMKAWNKEFRGSAMDAVMDTVLTVEIERQAVLSDGTFGPPTKVGRVKMAADPKAKPAADRVLPEYTGKNADIVRKAIQTFSQGAQNEVLRPRYWQIWSQTTESWTTPWIKAEVPDEDVAPSAAKAPAPAKVDDGVTELWFHDTNVVVQRKYRYRMRLAFINPLYTYDEIVYKGTPKDARVEAIYSGWSQWVLADAIPRTTQYFLTSAQGMGNKQELKCTIFTRSLGQVVSDNKFVVAVGRMIGGVLPKQIKNPAGNVVPKVVDVQCL